MCKKTTSKQLLKTGCENLKILSKKITINKYQNYIIFKENQISFKLQFENN